MTCLRILGLFCLIICLVQVNAQQTTGGNANGASCQIPFTYNGVTYLACTTVENAGVLWCYTDESRRIWGNCLDTPTTDLVTENGQKCAIPFNYGTKTYYACTTDDSSVNRLWCSTTFDYSGLWGYCKTTGPPTTTRCGTYQITNGVQYYGAPSAGANTIAQCETDCKNDVNCLGFDWVKSTSTCWPHVDATKLVASNMGANADIDHYRFMEQPCDGATPAPCTDFQFVKTENKHGFGGVEQPGVTTVAACEARCRASATCNGFDFTEPNGGCWLHDSTNTVLADLAGTNNYKKEPCPGVSTSLAPGQTTVAPGECVDTFTVTVSIGYYGGQEDTTADNTIARCENECRKEATCVGFDFDSAGKKCWYHKDKANFDNSYSAAATFSHHRRIPCQPVGTTAAPGVCVDSFDLVANKGSYNGNKKVNVANLEDCQAECRKEDTCVAIDFTNSNECYTHINGNLIQRRFDSTTVNQYVRKRCAPDVTASPGVCVDSYTEIAGQGSMGGNIVGGVTTKNACQAECDKKADCTGFDMSTDCFLHTKEPKDRTNYTWSGVKQYNRVRCPTTTTVSPPTCVDTYTAIANTGSRGGEGQPGADTLQKCEETCTAKTNCFGLDYNSITNLCYHHLTADFATAANQYSASGVIQETRKFCEPTACVDTYTETTDKGSQGGVEEIGANTVDLCKTACNQKSATECYGFDFSSNRCYLHSKSDFAASGVTRSGVNQYVRQPCPTVCVDSYDEVANRGSQGGVEESGANTVDLCKAACTKKSSTECYGFDFDTRCYLHSKADFVSSGITRNGVTQYVRKACPTVCVDSYEKTDQRFTLGGAEDTSSDTEEKCKQACNNKAATECYGFDFTGSKCYLHAASDFVSRSTTGSGVAQYVRKPCESVCVDTYDLSANRGSGGGIEEPNANTVDLCKAVCNGRSATACYGFDFDTNRCYLHSASDFASRAIVRTGVNQYLRVPCTTGVTTPGPTPAVTPAETTPLGCVETYTMTSNKHAVGGTDYPAATSVASCQTQCNSMSTCVGFDYNVMTTSGTRCFLLTQESQKNQINDLTGVNHYVRDNNCDGGATCLDAYTTHSSTGSRGGSAHAAGNTFNLCLTYCRTTPACLAFDYDTGTNVNTRCFIHLNEDYNTAGKLYTPGSAVTQYRMVRTCNPPSTTTAATTTSQPANTPEPGCTMIVRDRSYAGQGTPVGIMTAQQCSDRCLTDITCRASQYEYSSQQCYTFTVYSVGSSNGCCVRYQKSCTGK